ncbi:MAG: hypothetical protein LRY73_08490 [Bacillus sp. (in: Bacteria)]|nr:hypothetical protein [Bacillus sp. (in: firmicutes)]
MNNQLLELIGLWIEAVGQITSATGETRELMEGSDLNALLIVIGEGLQSIGEGLQGVGGDEPGSRFGSFIESAGAGTSSYAAWKFLAERSDEFVRLGVVGDSLQGLGAAIAAEAEEDPIFILGNKLESIGAALEAIGGLAQVEGEGEKGQQLNVLGSWLQATGGLLQSIYLSKLLREEGEI